MTPADLSRCVVRAVRCAVEDGELSADVVVPERVVVERTRPGGVGDYATPVAFQVAKSAGRPPGDVAGVLGRRLAAVPGVASVDVTGAGFLNFTLAPLSTAGLVREVRARGLRYGYADGAFGVEPFCWARTAEPRQRAVDEAVVRLLRSQGDGHGGRRRALLPLPGGTGTWWVSTDAMLPPGPC